MLVLMSYPVYSEDLSASFIVFVPQKSAITYSLIRSFLSLLRFEFPIVDAFQILGGNLLRYKTVWCNYWFSVSCVHWICYSLSSCKVTCLDKKLKFYPWNKNQKSLQSNFQAGHPWLSKGSSNDAEFPAD